jgi:hypothetical protein
MVRRGFHMGDTVKRHNAIQSYKGFREYRSLERLASYINRADLASY